MLARLTRIYERKDVAQAVKTVDKKVMRRNVLRRPSADETKRQRQPMSTLPDADPTIAEDVVTTVPIPAPQPVMVQASKPRIVQPLGEFR